MTIALQHKRSGRYWREEAQPILVEALTDATQFAGEDDARRALTRAGAPLDGFKPVPIDNPGSPLSAIWTPER